MERLEFYLIEGYRYNQSVLERKELISSLDDCNRKVTHLVMILL